METIEVIAKRLLDEVFDKAGFFENAIGTDDEGYVAALDGPRAAVII